MYKLIKIISLLIFLIFSQAEASKGEWDDFACIGKCDKSIKYITSHIPNYKGTLESNVFRVYRNLRRGLYECYTRDELSVSIVESEFYPDIKMGEIRVYESTSSGFYFVQLYIEINFKEPSSTEIRAWGNSGTGRWKYPAKNIELIAEDGIETDCERVFEYNETKNKVPRL